MIIVCPAYGPAAPIWRINGLLYGATSLPNYFRSAYENLRIPVVEVNIDNYSFQCFIPTGINSNVLGSSVGVLNVESEPGAIQNGVDRSKVLSNALSINHQGLHFSADNLTISWLYSENIPPDCSSVFFRVQGWACTTLDDQPLGDPLLVWSQNVTSGMNITIDSSDMMDKNVPIFVTLEAIKMSEPTTVCKSLQFGLQIKQSSKLKSGLCVYS